jgi:serine acetyltransferase/dTDP-4-dehydrorhamnose 3,5-epimerase-like enzyme
MSADIDATAICEARAIGDGSRILPFARIGPEVDIGAGVVISDYAVVDGNVGLADGVEVHAGARLIGSVTVGPGAIIGINSVVAGGNQEVTVGRGAVVKPGSVISENVPANAIVSGNPARIVAYADGEDEAQAREVVVPSSSEADVTETRVPGVTIHRLTNARDLRGSLTAAEFSNLPFVPTRLFTVYDVPSESVRGAHAHRKCAQLLVCLAGSLSCLVDDGSVREEIRLANSEVGLHIPPMIWGTQWKYTRDAVLLVLASHSYDATDYIRDYEQFLELVANRPA